MRLGKGFLRILKPPGGGLTFLPICITFAVCLTYATYDKFATSGAENVAPKIVRWTSSSQTEGNENDRIFFHETTGRNMLNLRQLCAVESAAKENPDRPVQLFMQSDDVDESSPIIPVLSNYPNVVIVLVNATEYFSNTPLDDWYRSTVWRNGPYRTEHFSDYIRILSLYKAGGMYMDLDFVTLKSFDRDTYWNFVPEEDNGVLTGSAIHFEKGHAILKLMLKYLATSYLPDVWSHSGPTMIQRTVLKFCHKNYPKPLYPKSICHGIKVLPRKFMYPYRFGEWMRFFDEDPSPLDVAFKSAALHMYNKLSKRQPIIVGSNQIYSKVARDHCPMTYAQAVDSF